MKKKLPKDFNAKLYYMIHPDVKDARMDAEEHYLKFGLAEGREYKFPVGQPKICQPLSLMDINDLKNDGVSVFGVSQKPTQRTIIVLGIARSGTSMAAKALEEIGVFMGDHRHKAVYEDKRLAEALERNTDNLGDIVDEYNNRFDVWGFKRPGPMVWNYLETDIKKFRNPHIVVMFRDPLAISKRNNISVGSSLENELRKTSKLTIDLVDFALSINVPKMMVSYEKAAMSPDYFVGKLIEFTGLRPSSRAIQNATSSIVNGPEIYLKTSQTRYRVGELIN